MADVKPDIPSSTYTAMAADWQLVRAVRGGASAVRAGGKLYLPQFPSESEEDFRRRVANAPFSAHYEDAARALIAKPFSKEVTLQGNIPQSIREWSENIDFAGHNLHTFTETLFAEALHMGAAFIYVDYPNTEGAVNLAQERAAGGRPYFRLIPIDEMLAIYEGTRGGRTIVRQIRFRDNVLELDDLTETLVERIRVVDDVDGIVQDRLFIKGENGWAQSAETIVEGMTEIPLSPVIFGLDVNGRFGIKPTMLDLAYKQIEHYQHANRLNEIFDFAGFPMLQAKGMQSPTQTVTGPDGNETTEMVPIRVGPRTVLFAPASQDGVRPEWGFVEPSAQSIKEVREHLKDLEAEMRVLGLQPIMPSIGVQNMAATTSAITVARTHSAVQAWAMRTKDALELALVFMARWAKLPETAECYVHTDFSAEILADADEKLLLEALTLGRITLDTWWDEMQRRGILGPQFDKTKEASALASGGDDLGMGEDEIDQTVDDDQQAA